MKKIGNLSLSSQGLKYKLKISFYLMSILPLLVCLYLVSNYILPKFGLKLDIAITIIISIFVACIGFFVIKEIIDRILAVSSDAKLIAAGDIMRTVESSREDEVGDLGNALNLLTDRIRSNMDELKNYGEKTTEINIEIQKRVLVLSSLLQVSSLISQGAKLDDIFKLTAEKARLLANSELSYLLFRNDNQETFYMKAVDGMNVGHLLKITVDPDEKIFARLVDSNRPAILDKENVFPEKYVAEFYDKFKIKNNLALPVYLKGRVIAILGIGNSRQQFLYGKDDVELLDIFAKQISIAVENDLLLHKVEKLEIKDTLTGLYNDGFIRTRLQEEIKRAVVYQRPCAFILFDIDNFEKFHQNCGSLVAESSLKKIAVLIKDSVSEIDKVGRVGDDEFAIILPEKNKRQAQEIADDIRKKVEFAFSEDPDSKKHLTVSAGVSENPLDGIDSQELLSKAQGYVKLAKDKGKNRVVVIN